MTHAHSVKRLVLVDDDKMEERILRSYLQKAGAVAELTAYSSGEDFLEYMEHTKADLELMPDLVLLDVRMPGLSGFDVLARIRAESEFSEEPTILMFSNSKDESDIQKALALGANEYKTKPYEGDAYIELINELGLVP